MTKRKPLTQNEDAFLKGEDAIAPVPPTNQAAPVEQPKEESSVMDSILSPKEKPPKVLLKRFTADLSEDLHDRLNRAAHQAKKTKVELLREMLEAFLPE